MLTDARDLPSRSNFEADVCVIGGGPAGLTLASKLRGLRVILLESGGLSVAADTKALAMGEITGEPYWALETSRLRCLGGTSTHWTGWCRPLDSEDFAVRPWIEDSGWPISYEELLPYYREAQAVCDLGPFEYDAAEWAARLGCSLLPLDRTQIETTLWQLSPPTRFGEKYRAALAAASDLEVYLNTTAVELRTKPSGEHVDEVFAKTLNGKELRVRAKAFVLAAGGIDNARLLLASGAGPGVGNESGLVGRYFLEHPHTVLGTLVCSKSDALRIYEGTLSVPSSAPVAVRATLSLTREAQQRERLLDCTLGLEPVLGEPRYTSGSAQSALSLARQLQGIEPDATFELHARAEQLPSPRSYLSLSPKRDALGMQQVALSWNHDPRTIASMRRTLELLAESVARARVGRVYSYMHEGAGGPGDWPEIFGGFHHMGTTRMHDDPRRGVVDRDCRVHSSNNLFVAGSSVFPCSSAANPTLTLVALAARLAETLQRSFG